MNKNEIVDEPVIETDEGDEEHLCPEGTHWDDKTKQCVENEIGT